MKHLVVTADDLGADRARNRGIFEAVRGGAVTSVSVLVNGPAFDDCRDELAELARGGLSVGLHLNLSEGTPLTHGLVRVAEGGVFPGKWAAHERLEDAADHDLRREVAREIEAQFQALEAAGFAPDHLDGHQHIHLWPAVLPLALKTARDFGVHWVRIPDQPVSTTDGAVKPTPGWGRFAARGAAARPVVEAAGLRCADHFRGLDLVDLLDLDALRRVVGELADGVTELMVHPGRAGPVDGPFSGFSTACREAECRALLEPGFQRAVVEAGASLGPFPQAAG